MISEVDYIKEVLTMASIGRVESIFRMLLNDEIEYNIHFVGEVEQKDLENLFSLQSDSEIYAIYIKCESKDLNISMIYFITHEEAKKLASILLQTNINNIDEFAISALIEVGNIFLVGAFANSISNITKRNIECSIPGFSNETLRTILQYASLEQYTDNGKILVLNEILRCKNSDITLNVIFLFNTTEIKNIVNSR
ncbi:MAG: hypothetical protein QXT32_00855 [Candidatus Nitrosocaldaceae archaeon]